MDLGKRKEALRQLTDAAHLAADKALLEAKKPHSRALKIKFPTKERTQREVLWELLDVVSPDDIKSNRAFAAKAAEEAAEKKRIADEEAEAERQRIAEEAQKLKAKEEAIKKGLKKNEGLKRVIVICQSDKKDYPEMKKLVKELEIETADVKKATLEEALLAYRDEQVKKANAILKDLVLDMDADYYQMRFLVAALSVEADEESHKDLVWRLKEFRGDIAENAGSGAELPPADNTEKTDEGTGEANEEVQDENEDLKEELEEKTEELEQTQDELEQTQDELEEKNEELAAEKKSEPASAPQQENTQQ
ncbi:hypothetical protein [Carboxylicivirga marina]|uniref:hypothetical protein n=1 Tax=Carboxylicivirga marina TaxID=2800988 RepID=UPI00259646FB|nr:hypothetical protein [uncultured Carboxylicivirga sp.]